MDRWLRELLLASVVALLACGGPAAEPVQPAPGPGESHDTAAERDAIRGIEDPALARVVAAHWAWVLAESPTFATSLGVHDHDDRLAVSDEAAIAATRRRRAELLASARAIPERGLTPRDRVTRAQLIETLAAETAGEVCELETWLVSPHANPVTWLMGLADEHPLPTPADGDNLLARYRMMPAVIDASIANLRRGIAAGRSGNARSVERLLAQLDAALAEPVASWALMAPASEAPAGWPAERHEAFARELATVVRERIQPAFERYRDFVAAEILPRARRDPAGLTGLDLGADCYRARIRYYLGEERTPEALHELGLREVARINDEMETLGKKLLGTGELAEILSRLRGDASLFYTSGDEILADARAALARAKEAVPAHFGLVPQADCVVEEMPAYEAPFSTIAYYQQPFADGSKPGRYTVNTHEPHTRPRFAMEVLSFHESIPGHHLQIAIAQELADLPAFRRHGGSTAFVEGWALYSERLAEEMGLYSSDLQRMGVLGYDAWRAARLVVDTGIHAMGWSRERAEAYMLAHTALSAPNIANEVDRYISWPGQALAYKVGQLEILEARAVARAALGPSFDIRGFHDAVLGSGAVTLPVMRANVEAWVEEVRAGQSRGPAAVD